MKDNNAKTLFSNSVKEQKILLNDERFTTINEKVSHSVSKVMNWLLVALLFITGSIFKNFTCLFIISAIVILKFLLTIIYSYYYNKKI